MFDDDNLVRGQNESYNKYEGEPANKDRLHYTKEITLILLNTICLRNFFLLW